MYNRSSRGRSGRNRGYVRSSTRGGVRGRGRPYQAQQNERPRTDYRSTSTRRNPNGTRGGRGRSASRGGRRAQAASRSNTRPPHNTEGLVDQILARVMAVLDERNGPRANAQPSRGADRGNQNVPQPAREGNQYFRSDNEDFPDLIRHTFRFIQTTHHYENWQNVPTKVDQAINKVVDNIRPPAPGPEITSQLGRAAETFKMSIASAMKKHLQNQAEKSKNALQELHHGDWKQAESIARGRYDKRYGARARNTTVTEAISALKPVFSKDWTKPKKTTRATQQERGEPSIPLANRFENLEQEGSEEALDALLEAMDAVPPSPNAGPTFRVPTRPRRRRNSSPGSDAPAKRSASEKRTPDNGRPTPSPLPGASESAPPTPARSVITPVVSPAITGGRSYADVVIGNPQSRQNWQIGNIPNNIANVILTDSNGLSWRNTGIPDNTVVYALRGGRLNDGARILSHDKQQLESVRTIIVALGLNDRDRDPSDIITNIRFLQDWSKRAAKNVFFLGVPFFDTLNQAEQNNINFLNQSAADIFGPQYIAPIRPEDVHITDRDGYGIHYSVITANATLDLVSTFLN